MLRPKRILQGAAKIKTAAPKIIQGGARSHIGGNVAFDAKLGRSGGFRYINGPMKGRIAPRSALHAMAPPPKAPHLMAGHGKKVAGAVAVGALGYGIISNKSGKGVDDQTGLPRRMYNY